MKPAISTAALSPSAPKGKKPATLSTRSPVAQGAPDGSNQSSPVAGGKRSTLNPVASPPRQNKPAQPKKAPRAKPEENEEREDAGQQDHDDMQPLELRKVPDDQIKDLTPEQKAEVFTKVITATNPNLSKAITRYSFREQTFKLEPPVDHLTVHFSMESTLILRDSDEGRSQVAKIKAREARGAEKKDGSKESKSTTTSTTTTTTTSTTSTSAGAGDDEVGEDPTDETPDLAGRVLKNQFNFSERASQTFNNPMRDREVATEPPPTCDFSGNATQWEMYDAYLADVLKAVSQRNAKEQSKAKNSGKDEKSDSSLSSAAELENNALENVFRSSSMANALKIMERMVNQNAQDEIFHQFKYFEDAEDTAREDGKGDFFPLWRFTSHLAKRKTVTALCWNPQYTDMFAVGYGSYDFMTQGGGVVCIYSLKNTSHPELVLNMDSGVMCIAFHPHHPSLLAVGLYDGTVAVYDIKLKQNKPIYSSSDPKVKHTDPVWQVYWDEADKDAGSKELSFYSISSDGRVTSWIMNKNELLNEEVMELKLSQPRVGKDDSKERKSLSSDKLSQEDPDLNDPETEAALLGLAGGSCFDFNKSAAHLFVVGTEEGAIHSYSKAYNSQVIESYEGHHMAVYSVRWNPFHPRIFLSCSADWTVKLWDCTVATPLMTFDLNSPVGDVAWSPYSSTVFATVTNDGKLRVYDLKVNKHEPVGESRVVKKAKLTHVSFNPKEPVLLVGDDTGVVMSLKLSPNLRKMNAPKIEDIDARVEVDKLEKLLILPPNNKANLFTPFLNVAQSSSAAAAAAAPAAKQAVEAKTQ